MMDAKKGAQNRPGAAIVPDGDAPAGRPSLTIDYALYLKYLDDSDWPEEKKREFIETLWSIIVSFVDLGFGVHPLQQAHDNCEPFEIPREFLPPSCRNMIQSEDCPKTDFEQAAGDGQSRVRERSRK